MISKYSSQTQGILLALFAMLTFSINDGAFKYAMQVMTVPAAATFGGLFSLLFIILYGSFKKISLLPHSKTKGAIYALFFTLEQIAFIYALKYIPLAELFVVVLASPVCVLVLSSLLLKEHLNPQQVMAVIFGFAGALIVVSFPVLTNTAQASTSVSLFAWIAAFASIAANSLKIIFLRKYCQSENTFSLAFFSIAMLTLFFATQISWANLSLPPSAGFFLFLGGMIAGLGSALYVRAFQLSIAPLVSATQYSQILWAVVMGVFIFNEPVIFTTIAGIILILLSGYLLYFRRLENYPYAWQ